MVRGRLAPPRLSHPKPQIKVPPKERPLVMQVMEGTLLQLISPVDPAQETYPEPGTPFSPKQCLQSDAVTGALLDDPVLSLTEKLCGVDLFRRLNVQRGVAWPSRSTIAATLRIHPDSVSRCLRRLEDRGFIRVRRRGRRSSMIAFVWRGAYAERVRSDKTVEPLDLEWRSRTTPVIVSRGRPNREHGLPRMSDQEAARSDAGVRLGPLDLTLESDLSNTGSEVVKSSKQAAAGSIPKSKNKNHNHPKTEARLREIWVPRWDLAQVTLFVGRLAELGRKHELSDSELAEHLPALKGDEKTPQLLVIRTEESIANGADERCQMAEGKRRKENRRKQFAAEGLDGSRFEYTSEMSKRLRLALLELDNNHGFRHLTEHFPHLVCAGIDPERRKLVILAETPEIREKCLPILEPLGGLIKDWCPGGAVIIDRSGCCEQFE